MLGYITTIDKLSLSVSAGSGRAPLTLSANPFTAINRMPRGLVAINGDVYNTLPENTPVLISHRDGGVSIKQDFTTFEVADAKFVCGGDCLLLDRGFAIPEDVFAFAPYSTESDRMGVGVLPSGELVFLVVNGTTVDLQQAFLLLGALDAMMLASGEVYVNDAIGGTNMGTKPLTVLEARAFKPLPTPIVVIDPGHGGKDPGATHYNLKEADVTLAFAKTMQKYLEENYIGTFLLTRSTNTTMELRDRTNQSNGINADFFISIHTNSASNPAAHGYESFVWTNPGKVAEDVQRVVHTHVMNYLKPFGIVDRGMKRANFHVLRETKCPAMLIENLFINNIQQNRLLADRNFVEKLALTTAEGLAKALKLGRVLTKPEISPTPAQPDVLYRVQVGAFSYRKGAEETLERLKKAGFNGIIVTEKK